MHLVHNGYLCLSLEELSLASGTNPCFLNKVLKFSTMEPQTDRIWTADKFITQIEQAAKIAKFISLFNSILGCRNTVGDGRVKKSF